MAEPHICDAAWQTSNPQDEWIKLVNASPYTVTLTGRKLTDETATQQQPHIYTFPSYTDNRPVTLASYQRAFVVSGSGTNGWYPVDGLSTLVLYWDRRATVWNNTGDVAYLREANGTIIDWCTVGHPPRHPGH